MNNYHSSNFSTVFFLVVIFIGTGVLLYHTYEVSLENGQLKEALGTLEANMAILQTENESLKTENTAIQLENTKLTTENSNLKTEMVKVIAENTSLKASDADTLGEVETLRGENSALRMENQLLKEMKSSNLDGNKSAPGVLQSIILPTDLDFWMKVAVIVLVEAILFLGYKYYVLLRGIFIKKTLIKQQTYDKSSLSRDYRYNNVIDSNFVDK